MNSLSLIAGAIILCISVLIDLPTYVIDITATVDINMVLMAIGIGYIAMAILGLYRMRKS